MTAADRDLAIEADLSVRDVIADALLISGTAFVTIGRRVAYTRAALGEFVAAQTRRHTGEAGR